MKLIDEVDVKMALEKGTSDLKIIHKRILDLYDELIEVDSVIRSVAMKSPKYGNIGGGVGGIKKDLADIMLRHEQTARARGKDCIIFLEGQYPIYDWKNLPFGTKEWKESEQLAGKEGYKNPVRVVFNKETMTYRTITSKSAIQFLDKKDVEFYKAAEKTDDTIKVFEMSEEEFLYLNWRKEPPLSEDEVAKIFEQAKMEKINPNEKVPEDVEGLSEQKKSQIGERKDHDLSGSITECIKRYIKELNQEQIDQILTGLEEGLTEKQVKTYFFLPVEKQSQYRRAYLFANKK